MLTVAQKHRAYCVSMILAPLSRRLLLCIVLNSGVSVNDVNKD